MQQGHSKNLCCLQNKVPCFEISELIFPSVRYLTISQITKTVARLFLGCKCARKKTDYQFLQISVALIESKSEALWITVTTRLSK